MPWIFFLKNWHEKGSVWCWWLSNDKETHLIGVETSMQKPPSFFSFQRLKKIYSSGVRWRKGQRSARSVPYEWKWTWRVITGVWEIPPSTGVSWRNTYVVETNTSMLEFLQLLQSFKWYYKRLTVDKKLICIFHL